MGTYVEQIGLREKLARNLMVTGRRLHQLSASNIHGSWLNTGLSAFLTFGNLALFYGAVQGEAQHLQVLKLASEAQDFVLASKAAQLRNFDLQVMNSVFFSMPIEAISLIGVMIHQNKHYPDQDIPLSTYVLPRLGNFSIRLGMKLMPKPLPDPTLW